MALEQKIRHLGGAVECNNEVENILVKDGKVLMTETKVPSGTVINFPGGGLELGEDPSAAVVREFEEETNSKVHLGELLYTSRLFHQNKDYPSEQVFHVYYSVILLSETPVTVGHFHDVVELHWFGIDEIPLERVAPPDLEFIESSQFRNLF